MNDIDKKITDLVITVNKLAVMQEVTTNNVNKVNEEFKQLLENVCSRDFCLTIKQRVEKLEEDNEKLKETSIKIMWKFITIVVGVFVTFICAELGIKFVL